MNARIVLICAIAVTVSYGGGGGALAADGTTAEAGNLRLGPILKFGDRQVSAAVMGSDGRVWVLRERPVSPQSGRSD
jgi:hypothetical protein